MKFLYLFLLSFIFLNLSACASTRSINFNGQKATAIDCSGRMVDISVCYDKAKQLCPNGYTILSNKISSFNPYPSNTALGVSAMIAQSNPDMFGVKGIVVTCK